MKKLKNISRQVIILGMVSFFTDFASEMLYPIVPIFLTSALGASMGMVGLIEGVAEVTAGLLKGVFGGLSDKLGKRSIFVVIGYGLSAIVKPLPGLLPYVSTVLVSRTSDRIGKGIRTAPRDALLASYSYGKTGTVFGFHRSMDTLGAVAGPLAALLILWILPGDYTAVFFFAAVPSVFAIAFTFRVKDPASTAPIAKKRHYRDFWLSAPAVYKKVLILLTVFSIVNSSDVFLILKSRDMARSDFIAILGYVFYNFVYASFSYPLGIVADKVGKRNIYAGGLFVFSAVYTGFALNNSLILVWVLFAFYGIFTAATEGVAKAWISDLIEDRYRGTAIGLLTTLMSLGVMGGSVLTGILWDLFGPRIPFTISAAVSAVIALLLLTVREK